MYVASQVAIATYAFFDRTVAALYCFHPNLMSSHNVTYLKPSFKRNLRYVTLAICIGPYT